MKWFLFVFFFVFLRVTSWIPALGEDRVLTGKMVRVRYARDRIVPYYLDGDGPEWREVAERLLDLFRAHKGRTRGALEEELRDAFGDATTQLVHQGLAKLLEDRCEFEVVSGQPPEQLREAVFKLAAARRRESRPGQHAFDRAAVLAEVGATVGLEAPAVDQGLFADLKSEQALTEFKDITAERLLQRYNVALAQAVLLRSTGVTVNVRGEPPQRYRQLFRQVKFHRLVCEAEATGPGACCLRLDGPLSLFTSTQKYGLQLALFLPSLLQCRDFDLHADLRWGPQRKPKVFTLSARDGLVSDRPDTGMYVPPELAMFVELFRGKVEGWMISQEVDVQQLGSGFWVPDFRLEHKVSGRTVLMEVLGFWRRSSVERHLERLRAHAREPFLLAVSDQLRIDDAELEGLPGAVYRFRQMPLADEVARLAEAILKQAASGDAD
jgi:predicted nuclease of restriction endonuclease-like RecB superfamily